MATINDVARACGVSPTTVSFVLNNGPRPVSAQTRQRVLEAMERLNYQPSAVARGLARQRMYTLGVLFSGHDPRIVHNPYAVALLDGIVAAATARGYDVTLITRHWKTVDEPGSAISDGRCDGILILTPLAGADAALGRSARNRPLVQIGAPAVLPTTLWMDVDNAEGARLAARHLLDLGHRRIALLVGKTLYEHVVERRRVFEQELVAAGVIPTILEVPADESMARQEQALRELLNPLDRPEALLATSDALAFAALRVARSLGLPVPERLSVVGFDDAPNSEAELVGLTTVRQPLFEMGQAAAEALVGRIEQPEERPETMSRLFPPELIVRHSTAPPPPI